MQQYIGFIVAAVLLVCNLAALFYLKRYLQLLFLDSQKQLRGDVVQIMGNINSSNSDVMLKNQQQLNQMLAQQIQQFSASLAAVEEQRTKSNQQALEEMRRQLQQMGQNNEDRLEAIRTTLQNRIASLQEENTRQLEKMQGIVDEKLQKSLDEKLTQSFAQVSQRLEQVYKGLGEMQTIASGVGDLKKVLSNVKTRGILGEIQLGAILEQILAPEQYETNVVTRPGSGNPVEFAVKMPGESGEYVYLPIDSKFPADAYGDLMDAYDSADKDKIAQAGAVLESRIKRFAKDIRDKYIYPPHTTDFAIMFLPTEGLYSEVVRRGMVQTLQRDYHINIAGPTTMAALLNSLQMGFRTLAIQRRSSEVWEILAAVKSEFNTFADVLQSTQRKLEQAGNDLDKLVGVRTRQIQRKLKDVSALNQTDAKNLLNKE